MRILDRAVTALLRAIVVISLCGMSLLTVADATGRYLLNRPIMGTVEMVELLMVAVIFASIPLVTRARGHITVDSFSHLFSPATLRAQDCVAGLLALTVSACLAWVALRKAQSTADYGDMTPMLNIPLAPFVYAMAVLLALDAAYRLAALVGPAATQPEPTQDD
ncbi:TRAP transporter small permease [Bordetella parapertussis]|uniref:TRAP transporter small permease protein n=5 Tax=Bordetella TaxID=517 RepID=A0A0H3LVB8_BORBR|nr:MULTISPECIES: TRAP transporter small permease [Bordetella]KAK64956.1 TRAP transporter, DctQ-like membrane protein [Bordetella bronchiseptica 980-2]KCV32420.1 TRAP transporter, DctQ-like membrane protein [Bordetella bronchiseptica 00-P-2730]KDD58680.1 TRAP transporter, DctQ-like membrane protein [Bordetella bronchiseptica OSU553]SHS07318.1 2,3-diketo-L-gulonate TRAP transporter small permease protein YiaM [Mycobacteroides abscessus subsp. abscessus]AMG88705.1 TRAP transporter small permease 